MKSSSQFTFSQVPQAVIPRSAFNRSRTLKTAFDAGYLVPIACDEVLPGDTFNANLTAFMRLTTPTVPFMDNLYCDLFAFFVPNRLLWDDWQHFCGERDNPVADYDQDTVYTLPTLPTSSGVQVGSLADYFGIPTGVAGLTVQTLPLRAYYKIWDEWFRDENLQNAQYPTFIGAGTTDIDNLPLLRRGKRHDYFTSALPWPQKGPGVEIPLGGYAPVIGNGLSIGLTNGTDNAGLASANNQDNRFIFDRNGYGVDVTSSIPNVTNALAGRIGLTTDSDKSGLVADLSSATAATINSLREAFQVQKLYERDARGGTRYIEILRAHFGVVSPDARLQRPEYLGGAEIPIQIHSVAQTSSTDTTTPQGNLAATGHGAGSFHFSKSFVEHGYLLILASVRADLTYQQGLDKMWSRSTRFDFYWPALAHLGEQAVLNKEIFAQGTAADDAVFGFQERWAEYRYGISKITGKLRSGVTGSLDVWHLAQDFSSLPALNDSFIQDNPPVDRVVAVTSEPQFIFDSVLNLSCVRPMPVYSVPGLIDHF